MILSSLLERKSRYEMTEVEHIRIEPDFLVPVPSPDLDSEDEEDCQFDFDAQRIVNDGHVYWFEDNYNADDDTPLALNLPGSIEDEREEGEPWEEAFSNPRDVATEPVFNLLPGGKRKKRSFREKVRNTFFRRSSYRRAAYVIDSRTTTLADEIAESSEKLKKFIKNSMERLRPSETSWTNLESLFTGTNSNFIPLPYMNLMTAL